MRIESLLKNDILGMKVSYCLSYLTSNGDSIIHANGFLFDMDVFVERRALLHGCHNARNGFKNGSHEKL